MPLVDVTADVRVGGLVAALQNMRKTDYRRVYERLRKPTHKDQRAHRDAQRGPLGAWKALAATTKARYARLGIRRNRRILAKLPNPRQSIVSAKALVMRSKIRWSMAHQAGARVGHGAILPQRQFMWISPWLRSEAVKEFRRALLERWRNA